jgi:hypothetical protein
MNTIPNTQDELAGKTEDDTFRILARPSIHEMVELHRKWKIKHSRKDGSYNTVHNLSFVKHYGWTWFEYLRAKKEAGYTF